MLAIRRILGVVLVLFAALAIAACSGSAQVKVERAKVKAGEMPEGEEWSGVYYSQTYGHLHLIEEGGEASAKWRTVNGDKWGEMAGEVNGDLFRFEWTEHTIGMVGPSATSKGRGYFKYIPSETGVDPPTIKGEWGLGASEVGHKWTATKQPRQTPDPDSIQPDEIERHGEGGGWDESDQPQKRPEGDAAFGTGDEEEEEDEDEGLPPPTTDDDSEY